MRSSARPKQRPKMIYDRYNDCLEGADAKKMIIYRRAGRLIYSHRCAEASAVQAYRRKGITLAPGMKIGYVVKDAASWLVDLERDAAEFDALYYGGLLEKAWKEAAFVFDAARAEGSAKGYKY